MSDMSIGGNKYEPEKPLAHWPATAFGTLAVGVRQVGRLHRRHHHAVDRPRLIWRPRSSGLRIPMAATTPPSTQIPAELIIALRNSTKSTLC
jgi:hypothetical protein